MTYRVGIGEGMRRLGFEPREPHITCDGCGLVKNITSGRMGPPRWFLDGKAVPGWKLVREGEKRCDYCPVCR